MCVRANVNTPPRVIPTWSAAWCSRLTGHEVASGSRDETVRVWDMRTAKCQRMLQDHSSEVHDLVFSPDESLIISASKGKTVRVWDVTSATQLQCHRTKFFQPTLEFRDDGKEILAIGEAITISLYPSKCGTSTTPSQKLGSLRQSRESTATGLPTI